MKSSVNIGYVVFLSVVAALGGFLFGYDTAVISGTIAKVTAQFNLDTMSSGWYVGCALIGSIVGVLFAGILSDKLGRKRTMILSAILFSMVCYRLCGMCRFQSVGGLPYCRRCRYRCGFHCIPSLYIRGVGSSVSWTLGITLSISGYHWSFRSLSNELSVAYVC